MEKDSRLEIRIAQQQLEELDAIRATVNPPYTPSRSDVARMFITKGINDYKSDGVLPAVEFSLAERLTLFFQLFPQLPQETRSVTVVNQARQRPSVSFNDLVRHVYLKKYFWFFELDSQHVELLNYGFKYAPVSSVLNAKSNAETNKKFAEVVSIIEMFLDIENCLEHADGEYPSDLEIIENLSDRLNVPLKFNEFRAEFSELNEMADLLMMAKQPERYRRATSVNTVDLPWEFFGRMLSVYRDSLQGSPQISISRLKAMINDRRLG